MKRLLRDGFKHVRCFKSDFFAETHLLERTSDGSRWVYKLARPLPFLAWHEKAIFKRLEGVPGVPELGPDPGPRALLHRFVEGRTLKDIAETTSSSSRSKKRPRAIPDGFFDRLEDLAKALHARGVAYVDMNKPDNVIVDDDGNPALVDFQISVAFPRRHGRLLGALLGVLAREDLYHVRKHRRRFGCAKTAEEKRAGTEPSLLVRVHDILLRRPWLAFRRRVLPSHW